MFIPPEVMGAHIGPHRSQMTGRLHRLDFRAATAMVGHPGLEWDLLDVTDDERASITAWIALHKRFRSLLHSGDVVRFDPLDEASVAGGVHACDRSERSSPLPGGRRRRR